MAKQFVWHSYKSLWAMTCPIFGLPPSQRSCSKYADCQARIMSELELRTGERDEKLALNVERAVRTPPACWQAKTPAYRPGAGPQRAQLRNNSHAINRDLAWAG